MPFIIRWNVIWMQNQQQQQQSDAAMAYAASFGYLVSMFNESILSVVFDRIKIYCSFEMRVLTLKKIGIEREHKPWAESPPSQRHARNWEKHFYAMASVWWHNNIPSFIYRFSIVPDAVIHRAHTQLDVPSNR